MDEVEPGAFASRLAMALVTVMVSRDPSVAAELEQVLDVYQRSAPTETDRIAVDQCIATVRVALAGAKGALAVAAGERAAGSSDQPH